MRQKNEQASVHNVARYVTFHPRNADGTGQNPGGRKLPGQ